MGSLALSSFTGWHRNAAGFSILEVCALGRAGRYHYRLGVFENRQCIIDHFLHTSANATFNYLPILPENTGMIAGLWSLIGLIWLSVFVLVILRRDDLGLRYSD